MKCSSYAISGARAEFYLYTQSSLTEEENHEDQDDARSYDHSMKATVRRRAEDRRNRQYNVHPLRRRWCGRDPERSGRTPSFVVSHQIVPGIKESGLQDFMARRGNSVRDYDKKTKKSPVP